MVEIIETFQTRDFSAYYLYNIIFQFVHIRIKKQRVFCFFLIINFCLQTRITFHIFTDPFSYHASKSTYQLTHWKVVYIIHIKICTIRHTSKTERKYFRGEGECYANGEDGGTKKYLQRMTHRNYWSHRKFPEKTTTQPSGIQKNNEKTGINNGELIMWKFIPCQCLWMIIVSTVFWSEYSTNFAFAHNRWRQLMDSNPDKRSLSLIEIHSFIWWS